jgi:hypothetical protein
MARVVPFADVFVGAGCYTREPMPSQKHLPRIGRYAIVGSAVLLVVPLAFISLSAVWRVVAWRTVLSEQKAYPQGGGHFGFSLRSPSIGSNFALVFSGYGFSIELESPGTSLQKLGRNDGSATNVPSISGWI